VESKALPSGSSVASLSLAVNRSYKTESGATREEVLFVDVELWGRVAEIAAQYVKKGAPLYVEGRLKMDSWEDKETGQKRSKMKVVGEAIQLLGSKKDEDEAAPRSRPVVESGEADEIPF
jgi:single-strand DNA-binding protein